MKRSDITDKMVCEAYSDYRENEDGPFVDEILMERTAAPLKVVFAAMIRAKQNGLTECGASIRSGWLTEKGKQLLME